MSAQVLASMTAGLKPITGEVRDKQYPDGAVIDKPKSLTTGYWTPSDQALCPITPVKVVFQRGHWYSQTAFEALGKL